MMDDKTGIARQLPVLAKAFEKAFHLRGKVKAQWRLACEHDGIATDAEFVIFSDDNPYAVEYSAAMQRYLVAAKAVTNA